jgi:uncharacterized protein (DUF1800 family)
MSSDALTTQEAVLALGRLTYGPTAETLKQLTGKNLSLWLSSELSEVKPEQHPLLSGKTAFLTQRLNLQQTFRHPNFRRQTQNISEEAAAFTTIKRFYSTNQVLETLVELMSDYVPVPLYSPADWARADYDKVIRNNVLGTYPKLLAQLSLHPAMLYFLNGQTNTAVQPNENFGRELLELFTITPEAGYSEKDVLSVARMMSGISFSLIDFQTRATPSEHFFGRISVQGFTHANARTSDSKVILGRAQQMINHLAKQPATAEAFSYRMARRYLNDDPSPELIQAMKSTYLKTSGSIPKVLTTLVAHPDFLATPTVKVKRPAEHLASTVRALGLELSENLLEDKFEKGVLVIDALKMVLAILNQQGHLPFDWDTPDGFPEHASAWSTFGGQIQRWNMSTKLSQHHLKNIFSEPGLGQEILGYSTMDDLVTRVSRQLLSSPLRAFDQQEIVGLLTKNIYKQLPDQQLRERMSRMAFALVMATEEWNLR